MTMPPYQPGPYGRPGGRGQPPGGYGSRPTRPYVPPPHGQPPRAQPPPGPPPGQAPGPPPYGRPPRAQPQRGQPPYGPPPPGRQPYGRPPPRGRPAPDRQPYGEGRPYEQQPPYGPHSGGDAAHRAPPPANRIAYLVVAGAVVLLAGVVTAVLLLTGDENPRDTAAPRETSRPAPTSAAPTSELPPVGPGTAVDAEVGDCIKVNNASATEADIRTIDCADPLAVYKVGVRKDDGTAQCPGENYVSYTEENNLLLCMTLNAHEGECFHETELDDSRVGCGSPDVSYKVGDIFEGTEDAEKCGADARNALTYPEPPLTICRLQVE